MTSRRLNRNELARFFNNDPRAIREFERLFANVQANINGTSVLTLNYDSLGALTSPLPLVSTYTLVPEGGSAYSSGVSWGVVVTTGSFTGSAPTIAGTGAAQLRINSGLATPSAVLAITASVDGFGYPPFSVTVGRSVAAASGGGGGTSPGASDSALQTFNSGTFAPISTDLAVTLPSGVTTATLTAALVGLDLDAALPTGTTVVQFKWQRETAPSVWSDVGLAETSSPSPFVFSAGGFPEPANGSITCNRTETGMPAASAQKFRLVARISSGNVRTVYPIGTANVSS
jgi:hypothetical protein